jgi:hypothetical protein
MGMNIYSGFDVSLAIMIAMDSITRFILSMSVLMFCSLFAFFLTGVVLVRKDHQVVVSKKGAFVRVLTPGLYYYFPLVFSVTGQLPTKPEQMIIRLSSNKKVCLTYSVQDAKTYFESKIEISQIVRQIEKESPTNESRLQEIRQILSTIGIQVLDITER